MLPKLFGARLTPSQIEGVANIVEYGRRHGVSDLHLAYVLATAFHETAKWMQPIREGAVRYGKNYTDAQSRRAVASLHAKGIIRTNYALPAGPFKQSYYARGLVGITWYDNYLKFEKLLGIPLTEFPDLALEWEHALPMLFTGMIDGVYTTRKLSMIQSPADYYDARAIINADKKKNGRAIADTASVFLDALLSNKE